MNEREVLALKRKLEADYRKESEAIDIVLNLLRRKNSPNGSKPPESVDGSAHQQRRVRGVLAAVKRLLPFLPATFDRTDVSEMLGDAEPDLASKVSLGNIRGTLRLLQQDKVIEVVTPSSGTRAAVYKLAVNGLERQSDQ